MEITAPPSCEGAFFAMPSPSGVSALVTGCDPTPGPVTDALGARCPPPRTTARAAPGTTAWISSGAVRPAAAARWPWATVTSAAARACGLWPVAGDYGDATLGAGRFPDAGRGRPSRLRRHHRRAPRPNDCWPHRAPLSAQRRTAQRPGGGRAAPRRGLLHDVGTRRPWVALWGPDHPMFSFAKAICADRIGPVYASRPGAIGL